MGADPKPGTDPPKPTTQPPGDRGASQALLQEALANFQSGRVVEAERRLRASIAADPQLADACSNFGTALREMAPERIDELLFG